MKQMFPDIKKYKIADVGGSAHFWEKTGLDVDPKKITLFNVSENETGSYKRREEARFRLIIFDGKTLPVPDGEFDLVVCNSVVEHVSSDRRVDFAKELARVGKRVYVQTPAKEFPLEPHFLLPFIHWLPKNIGFWFVRISPWWLLAQPDRETTLSYYFNTNLLDEKELMELFHDYTLIREKVLGLTKSYMICSGCEQGKK